MAPPSEPPKSEPLDYTEVQTPHPNASRAVEVVGTADKSSTRIKQVSLLELFSFADTTDKLLMLLGTIGAFGAGLLRPILVLLYGDIINEFGDAGPADTPTLTMSSVRTASINFTIVGIAGFIAAYMQVYCWSLTASRQSKRIRSLYVNAIITKEIGWFDVNDPMQLSSRVADATITIQDGIGSKMSDMLHFSSTVVSGIVIALVKGWELTLILMAVVPFVTVSGMLAKKVIVATSNRSIHSYALAGAVAQVSLSNIRTVHMFNSVEHFIEKYRLALEGATLAGIKKEFAAGWAAPVAMMVDEFLRSFSQLCKEQWLWVKQDRIFRPSTLRALLHPTSSS
ncbi:unnamed protein product [Phytophthora lilii]|uniref:Unnamed protein product n=1 Tax=Phytophthora lilii TaxID=2077276 RepID=A0A9W6T9P5_9STRA|nr:unnamed protein product [Phytophthora lilii]